MCEIDTHYSNFKNLKLTGSVKKENENKAGKRGVDWSVHCPGKASSEGSEMEPWLLGFLNSLFSASEQ